MTRSSTWARTAAARTRRSMSRPLRVSASGESRWVTLSTLVRLVVGLGALEPGQERMVDVDASPGQLPGQVGREDLHVTGQHHQIDPFVVDDRQDLLFLVRLGLFGDRQMMERDAVQVAERLARVVGDDADHLHGQLADPSPIQQVDQTVIRLAGQHEDPVEPPRVTHVPVRIETGQHRPYADREAVFAEVGAHRGERDPGEEPTGQPVVELLPVRDVAAELQQRGGDRCHDARLVGAGEVEDVRRRGRCVGYRVGSWGGHDHSTG